MMYVRYAFKKSCINLDEICYSTYLIQVHSKKVLGSPDQRHYDF